jgi:hypothetical protein
MTPFTKRKRYLFAPIFLTAFAGFGFITMLLWNALLPEIFHFPQISYWQAVGLLILSRMLFGFHGPWHGHHGRRVRHLHEKWEQMNPQEREEFMKRRHQCRPGWEEADSTQTKRETSEYTES